MPATDTEVPLLPKLFLRKPIPERVEDALATNLKRTLGKWQLTALGVGAIIGAGIFSAAGTAIAGGADHVGAGPALVLSYIGVAIACGFAALCYAEFAAMIPESGSAYTYAYSTLGEVVAWIIGWDLIIEYAVGNIAVAVSWSGYFQQFLSGFGLALPEWMVTDPITATKAVHTVAQATSAGTLSSVAPYVVQAANALSEAPHLFGIPIVVNIPAVLIVALITWILVVGIRESSWFNVAMVVIKLGILGFFIVAGALYVRPANWTPFAPNGIKGIWTGAALIFFAYIGFDAVSTAAEETRHPQTDMPFAMIASLIITSILYIAVTLVLTGLVPWNHLGTAEPLATAFSERGLNMAAGIISVGALAATTSVLLVFQLGQPRILFSMARDGLLPPVVAKVHEKHRTPHVATIMTGVFVAFFAAFMPIDMIIELTNIGTLFAFVLVSIGIIVLRRLEPDRERPFRTPLVPLVPLIAIGSCVGLMAGLPAETWIRFVVWLVVGMTIYWFYGRRHTALGRWRVEPSLWNPLGERVTRRSMFVVTVASGLLLAAILIGTDWVKWVRVGLLLLAAGVAFVNVVAEVGRLHDLGRNGRWWWLLLILLLIPGLAFLLDRNGWWWLLLIPGLGFLVLAPGQAGVNQFGRDPRRSDHIGDSVLR